MRRTYLAAVALGSILATAACSASQPHQASTPAALASSAAAAPTTPAATATAEPRTYEAAKAAVDHLMALEKAHDYGGMWAMLTASGQAAMSRADYIKVVSGCSKMVGSQPALSIALNDAGTVATVKSTDDTGTPYEWQMIYENGHWKHQPSDGAMQWMSLSPDKALSFLRSGGAC